MLVDMLDIRIAIAFIWLALVPNVASAQYGAANSLGAGGYSGLSQGPTFGASAGSEMLRHRSPTGSPCLEVNGFSRRHTVNSNLYDHVVSATNSCAQSIRLQVCYFSSEDCVPMEVPGDERKEAILGTMPAMQDFRFEFKEKF